MKVLFKINPIENLDGILEIDESKLQSKTEEDRYYEIQEIIEQWVLARLGISHKLLNQ